MSTHYHISLPCTICGFPLEGQEAIDFVNLYKQKFEDGIKKMDVLLNLVNDNDNHRHPKCKGFKTQDRGWGSDYECGYETTIGCEECKYGGGRKNPEAKCNQ